MAKFRQKYYKPEGWRFSEDSIWMDVVWSARGSKPGVTYAVAYTPKGFTCECQGFGFHGYCKHSKGVVRKITRAIENPYRSQGYYEIG